MLLDLNYIVINFWYFSCIVDDTILKFWGISVGRNIHETITVFKALSSAAYFRNIFRFLGNLSFLWESELGKKKKKERDRQIGRQACNFRIWIKLIRNHQQNELFSSSKQTKQLSKSSIRLKVMYRHALKYICRMFHKRLPFLKLNNSLTIKQGK